MHGEIREAESGGEVTQGHRVKELDKKDPGTPWNGTTPDRLRREGSRDSQPVGPDLFIAYP